jgi:hypothetical protein
LTIVLTSNVPSSRASARRRETTRLMASSLTARPSQQAAIRSLERRLRDQYLHHARLAGFPPLRADDFATRRPNLCVTDPEWPEVGEIHRFEHANRGVRQIHRPASLTEDGRRALCRIRRVAGTDERVHCRRAGSDHPRDEGSMRTTVAGSPLSVVGVPDHRRGARSRPTVAMDLCGSEWAVSHGRTCIPPFGWPMCRTAYAS